MSTTSRFQVGNVVFGPQSVPMLSRLVMAEKIVRLEKVAQQKAEKRIAASDPAYESPEEYKRHDAIRNQATEAYRRTMRKIVYNSESNAIAEGQGADSHKARNAAIAALLFLLLAKEQYALTYNRLAGLAQDATGQPLKVITHADLEAISFSQERAKLLEDFPASVAARLEAEREAGEKAQESTEDIMKRLVRTAKNIEEGRGEVMARTEAQAIYGSAQLRLLKNAGFKTALWDQLDRPTKRDSHALNMELGPQPVGFLYPSNQRYPGDPLGGVEECINCECYLVGVSRGGNLVQASSTFDEIKHPRGKVGTHDGGKFTSKEGGIELKRIGEGKESKWKTHDNKEIPSHSEKLGIPPAWTKVRVAPTPEHDLQAIGYDTKGREQRIYSDAFTSKMAALKFSRNKELIDKADKIFKQNEENLNSEFPKVVENAACMKLIQQTGIRPGSDNDTGAEKQAYGATTLEGRHIVVNEGKVRLQFTGKKGVSLDIPVDDSSTAKMLIERKSEVGDDEKIFKTTDAALRDYSHTLDGGSFKPKDFRTLKGTRTAMEEIKSNPTPAKSFKEYKKRVMDIAKKVAEKLGNTPTIALQSYINPFVFEQIKPA